MCDYCVNPKSVSKLLEQFKNGVLLGRVRQGKGKMSTTDEDDMDLYGGGKRGAKK